jgi:hypothetical protein
MKKGKNAGCKRPKTIFSFPHMQHIIMMENYDKNLYSLHCKLNDETHSNTSFIYLSFALQQLIFKYLILKAPSHSRDDVIEGGKIIATNIHFY